MACLAYNDVMLTFKLITEFYVSINLNPSPLHFFSGEYVNAKQRSREYTNKYRIDIYIGSDNDSRRVHDIYLDKIKKWANATFPDGYTLVRGEGYYNGVSEDSILLHAFLNCDVVLKDRLQKLKRKLGQESILFVKSPANFELI